MKIKALIMLCACLFVATVQAQATSLNNIIVFGDSLSDNGNLYRYMENKMPASPPYYQGRFSNGPVWVEQLASAYFGSESRKHLADYAYGGAGVGEADSDALLTLDFEIQSYLLAHGSDTLEDNLFIVWIGANNYWVVTPDPNQTFRIVKEGIHRGLQQLAYHGAKHILVLNLPDLAQTPAGQESSDPSALSYATTRHNEDLVQTINDLKAQFPDVQWLLYDANQDMKTIFAHPETFGFTHLFEMCNPTQLNMRIKQPVLRMVANVHQDNNEVKACDGFIFFDSVHPTKATHALMAKNIEQFLAENGLSFTQ